MVVAILGVGSNQDSFVQWILWECKGECCKSKFKNFTQYAQSLLMKCHLGETKVYLKVNNESLPQSYNCEDAIQKFFKFIANLKF